MIPAKHKKFKPKKQHNAVQKHRKQADIAQLRSQLDALGLKIIQMTADGNSFFRALSDQLEVSEEECKNYHHMVVQYILNHRQDFEAFIEDEVPLITVVNPWKNMVHGLAIWNCKQLLLLPEEISVFIRSYHDGDHYSSVSLKEDSCEGPPRSIIIKVDSTISATDQNKKLTVNESKAASGRSLSDIGSVKLVMAGTGCENIDKVEQVFREVDDDVDAAIEFMIAE